MAQGCASGCKQVYWKVICRAVRTDSFIANLLIFLFILSCFGSTIGCNTLSPKPIIANQYHVPEELLKATDPVIERGKERPVLDTIGWIIGIPSKIILWDSRVDRHHISPETEQVLAQYIDDNGLQHVKFRLNQYAPIQDWKRLRKNKSVAWGWRYTFGAVSVLGEAILPGRLLGGDHYNPYTATVHIYSDIPAIAFHEAAHAKDFSRRDYPGTYAALYMLPVVPLWHESIASRDVVAYVEHLGSPQLEREAYHVLYPAFGTYVGGAAGAVFPDYADPLYLGGVLWGHAVGRWHGYQVPTDETYYSSRQAMITNSPPEEENGTETERFEAERELVDSEVSRGTKTQTSGSLPSGVVLSPR